jgi:hypothetical protein
MEVIPSSETQVDFYRTTSTWRYNPENLLFEVLIPWIVLSSGTLRREVRWKSTYVPEEHVATIFKVEEYAKH